MVNPDKKPVEKRKQFKDIDEYLKRIDNAGYGYYCNDPTSRVRDKLFNHRSGLNCNDFEYTEELNNRLKGKYIRENIARKATPEELEWIKRQEPVTDPEVLESLRPALEWMSKYVFTDEEE